MAAAGGLKEGRHADDSSTDLEGYRERMRANGRDVTLATVGINYTADGVPFIGPVDNESSRAKAVGKVLTIDQWECISCGTCVEQTADVFTLPARPRLKCSNKRARWISSRTPSTPARSPASLGLSGSSSPSSTQRAG